MKQILKVTGQENAPQQVKDNVFSTVESYYGSKGSASKFHAVGIIIEQLSVSFTNYAGPVSEALM